MAIAEVDDLHDTLMQFAERTSDFICSANSKLEFLVNEQSPELIAMNDDIFGSGATLEEIVTGSSEERSGKKVCLAKCLLPVTSSQLEEAVMTRPGPSLRPVLPPEILDNIFRLLKQRQLHPVLFANTFLYKIARRRFYHTIIIETPKDCVIFFRKVLSNPMLPPLVRSLELGIAHTTNTRSTRNGSATSNQAAPLPLPPGDPGFALPGPSPDAPQLTRNFYVLLRRGLREMHSLVSLTLELPKSHSPFWIFRGCTFKLRQFTTSMHCQRPLATFLESQATIEELTLRGFQRESLYFLPFLGAAAAALVTLGVGHTQGQSPTGSTSPYPSNQKSNSDSAFTLSPTALPRLKSFNAIHAGPSVIHTVMEGRSVEVASIPLFPERSIPTLDALGSGKASLKRLSVISFDPEAPEFLFEELSTRFRDLEALHMVMLMADYTRVGHLLQPSCVIVVPEFLRCNLESFGRFGTHSIPLHISKSVA